MEYPVWNATYRGKCPACYYDTRNQVGILLSPEFYRHHALWQCDCGACHGATIYFLSPSGWLVGRLHEPEYNYDDSILNWYLRTETIPEIGGGVYRVYQIQKRTAVIRNGVGTLLLTSPLAIGTEIATDEDTMGQTYLEYWLIRGVKRDGIWTHADNVDGRYAFVDTGLKFGSGPNGISIKTSLAT